MTKDVKQDIDKGFKLFRLGVSLFFLGLVLVYCASELLLPSISQELLAAAGILFLVLGFFLAIVAEGRLILARFINFFTKK